MLPLLFLFSLLKHSILQNPSTPHWDYQREGPDTWRHTFDSCEGNAQSPINIRTCSVKYDPNLSPLSLNGYTTNISLHVWNFTHNGHTIIAYPPPLAHLSISGANLPENFHLVQFHFHWGYNAYQGSEHTIDGMKYPLEIHFVHEGRYSNALAVLSILFTLRLEDNPHINELLSILNRTINTDVFVEQQINISRLFPATLTPQFYRYNGSLTIPPCTEGVTWIILARKVPISKYQLEIFVRNSVPFNFRSPQQLYSRTISANFRPEPHDEEGESSHHSSAYAKHIPVLLFSLILLIN
jgi:carbonic anhydrase